MIYKDYPASGDAYAQEYDLRNRTLRHPHGLDLKDEDLSRDFEDYHIGGFSEDGRLLATLMLHPTGVKGELQMRQVCTEPDERGKGIGSEMVRFCERFAKEKGYSRIILHGRAVAANFYKRLGYETDEELFYELGIPHYHFWKEI